MFWLGRTAFKTFVAVFAVLPAESRINRKNAKILKNFLLTQMAALVVVNLSRLKLSRTAIKKDDLTILTTNTIYKFFKRKTIAMIYSTF